MKKITLLKSMLLLCALVVGSTSVWAIEVPYKTLTFSADNDTKVNNYDGSWDETIGTDTWTITNFNNNNWNDSWKADGLQIIKCGKKRTGKSPDYVFAPSVATIITKAKIDKAITKVVVTLTAIDAATYNSIKLYVASDDAFTSDLQTINVSPIPTAAGDMTISVETPTTNRYYKLEFDTKGNKTTNGHTGITKVIYYQDITSLPAVFGAGKTMISFSDTNAALDLTTANLPSGLAAYKVTAADASSVTLTAVNSTVAKNTGIILTGSESTNYNIPVVGSGTDISGSNLLVASDGTSNVTNAYVLSASKFHPVAAAGVVIPAGKAYLPADYLSAHELDITFDNGDVTGIEAVETQKAFDGAFYNLNGQRVAQPAKGLYIVNGKKVVIK